jgi:hypothetical protein
MPLTCLGKLYTTPNAVDIWSAHVTLQSRFSYLVFSFAHHMYGSDENSRIAYPCC